MQTIKIFLASSEELRTDRDQFEIFIGRENQRLTEQNLFLKLIRWENFLDSMDKVRLQNEYNRAVKEAHIFVMLYSVKVGKYTAEEFETAYNHFKSTDRPLIYTYFKSLEVRNDQWRESDYKSLRKFQNKLVSLGHFETKYSSTAELELNFKQQLETLIHDRIIFQLFEETKVSDKDEGGNHTKDQKTEDEEISNIKNHNLPSRNYGSKLIGRVEYIQRILKAIGEAPIVTIEGFSGIGKTSIALEIAHIFLNSSDFKPPSDLKFDYLVWISAKNKEQKQWLNDVLNKVAEVLEHPSITQISTEHLSHKKREIEKVLRQPDHKLFLIIDNFETIDDPELQDWLLSLNEPNKVLITSQKHGFDSWHVNLKSLSDTESIALIRKYAEANDLNHLLPITDEKLLNLVRITGGNPLAIRLAIGQISGGNLSLDQVIDNLKENNPTASIDMVFNKIHETSWISIGTKAQQLILVTPLFIGSDSIEKNALEATSGLSKDEYEVATQTLLTWKLLEPNFDDINRLVIHPMTRRFVKNKLHQHSEFEKKARKSWYKYYLQYVNHFVVREQPAVEYWNALVDDKMENIDVEWPNIYEVLKWAAAEVSAENDNLLLDLVFLLVHYMDSRFYNLERITYVELAIDAASRLGKKYQEALLRIDALGWTYVEENRYDKAYNQIMQGIELAKEVSDLAIEKNELMALGYAWAARVNIEQDKPELVDEAFKLIKLASTFNDTTQPWIRFRILMAAGDIYLKQNKSKEALENFKNAKEQMTHYGGEGHYYQINPRIGLANLALGDLAEAEGIFTNLSNQKKISIGKLYGDYGLALIEFKKGNVKEANLLLDNVKDELSKRTSSNLLLKLIKEFERTLKQ
jgi:tetratricopeptide (TPR) repeat protein